MVKLLSQRSQVASKIPVEGYATGVQMDKDS